MTLLDYFCDTDVSVSLTAVSLKFRQNPHLQQILKATSGKMIAEASPSDSHWGLGLGLNDPKLQDQSKWGMNKMGNIFMIVRGSL